MKKRTIKTRKPRSYKKPAWNNYLTDATKFKMTKEERQEKRQMRISPHNRLIHGEKAVKRRIQTSKKTARRSKWKTRREKAEKVEERFVCPIQIQI